MIRKVMKRIVDGSISDSKGVKSHADISKDKDMTLENQG